MPIIATFLLYKISAYKTNVLCSVSLELDHNIKLDGSTVGKIERGERGIYDYELLAFSGILDVSVGWLLKGGELHFP